MALLKQCFCYSLRQGSFIIGSYSLVVYCVAFAVELWWIVESLLILPAPAYTLCALYFFDFIMAAILLFGLLVRQRKYLMSWTLMAVLSFFPEAGMVLFMSLYYWPAHKFEYGIIELVYWSLRAIFNIFGAVCVCSLYLTWRDEELILGRLHDLTLANVETGSTGVGVGVLRNGNFAGTLKGNSNLAYQNYAYVDTSPGLQDNLNYKNSSNFHSKKPPDLLGSLQQRRCIIQQQPHRERTNKYNFCYYYCPNKSQLCAQCQYLFPIDSLKASRKVVSSLPTLFTSDLRPSFPGGVACCDALRRGEEHQLFDHRSFVKCNCRLVKPTGNNGIGDDQDDLVVNCKGCGGSSNASCSIYNHCRGDSPALHRIDHHHPFTPYYCDCFKELEILSNPKHILEIACSSSSNRQQHCHSSQRLRKHSEQTVLNVASPPPPNNQQTEGDWKQVAPGTRLKEHTIDIDASPYCPNELFSESVDLDLNPDGLLRNEHLVPKIEIVICTEVHGSIETTVIRQNQKSRGRFTRTCHGSNNRKGYRSNNHFIPLNYFRRAVSDSPNIIIMERFHDSSSGGQLSSSNSMRAGNGSMDSSRSMMLGDGNNRPMYSYKKCGKDGLVEKRKQSCKHKGKHGVGGREGGRALKILGYIAHLARCCVSGSATSLLNLSGSQTGGGGELESSSNNSGGGKSPIGKPRGLFNTRSFAMNSDVQGSRAQLPMKSEFNPATLFDPAYRKSRISELGIAGIGLEPPGQIPIGTLNGMNRSRSLWNVSNEEYWNRPPPSRPVSMGYVNHIHQLDQHNAHSRECCLSSVNNNSNATMNLNKQMMLKGFGGCSQGYRNPIHGSTTSIASNLHLHPAMTPTGLHAYDAYGGILREPDHEHRRAWLATNGRRAQSVDGLNHFYHHHRHYGKNIAAHHNLHPGGIMSSGDHHSSICQDESDDLRNYQDIAL